MSASPQPEQDPSVPTPEALALIKETDLVFGRTVVPAPCTNTPVRHDGLRFEYAEHSYIGDAIMLTLANGSRVPARNHRFTLRNGLSVTYGQINGLAGDFYGTTNPISDGRTPQDQSTRFLAAYNKLAEPSSRQPQEARDILAVLQTEVDAVNEALQHHSDPSIAYAKLPGVNTKLETLTIGRPSDFPSYLGLARINWDHFGQDARSTYNAGHLLALQTAVNGDLSRAYTINAFADHFLEDSFSAGHLRTPRRGLHGTVDLFADMCAKAMHDEDCAIGLSVRNPAGQSWTCFGDKRALDSDGRENLRLAIAAVQASADEIHTAFRTRVIPPQSSYRAWTIAPTLASALGTQVLSPLFRYTNSSQTTVERRRVITNRRIREFTTNWWYWSTYAEINNSGWWNFPILIEGPLRVVPHTSIAATKPRIWSSRVYYQNPARGVHESQHLDGSWTGGVNQPRLWDAAPFTPLAAVNWDNGNQIRVYYLSDEYQLHEICFVGGRWIRGALNDMNIQCTHNSSVAAFTYLDRATRHIRVYCQVEGSNRIQEISHNVRWSRGATLPAALNGSSIAAIVYQQSGLWRIRVYYQVESLELREHCQNMGQNNNAWFPGIFNVGRAPGRTQIGALCSTWRGIVLDVYWLNANAEITRAVHGNGSSWQTSRVIGSLTIGTKFVPEQWDGGRHIRLYYQARDHSVREATNNNGAASWGTGSHIAQA
ncbi:fucose-specific lectin [Schizophyllum commune Tattone D]|nr:fucose-specific lectin [Schizophyllum commune Tattone D]